MNPLNWKREHQVALGIAAIIGAVLGTLIGYLVYAIAQGAAGAMSFGRWVEYSLWAAALLWAIVGALIVGGSAYAQRLFKE
jgi:uncharacterized membrane protein YhdT